MFSVIFIVQPRTERFNDYLELAKYLKPKLEAVEGFIDNERFRSLRDEGRILSLSTWRDEKAVVRWRTQGEHHGVQEKGRSAIFQDYHLQVGEIVYDSDPPRGLRVVEQRLDETEVGAARAVTLTELLPGEGADPGARLAGLAMQLGIDEHREGLLELEEFESIYNPGKLLLLGRWRDAEAAVHWVPVPLQSGQGLRQRRVRIIRDYGMFDRREAPQFYPEAPPRK